MHYYKFHISDYKSHTEHLTDMEDLAYRRMLDWQYLHEKHLPSSVEEIAKLIRMRTHCECIANVLKEYFIHSELGYLNKRAFDEICEINVKSEKARRSAAARWSKKTNKINGLESGKKSYANALRTQCEGNATQYPLINNINNVNEGGNDAVEKSSDRPSASSSKLDPGVSKNVQEIFNHWVMTMGKRPGSTKLTPKRKRSISNRLKDGYTSDQIKSAIKNCSKDPFYMGQNDRGKSFNDIELICRSGEKLESFFEETNTEVCHGKNQNTHRKLSAVEQVRFAYAEKRQREQEFFEHYAESSAGIEAMPF